MGIIKMNGNGGRKFFSYKQGYWFDKSVEEGHEDYSVQKLKDKDRNEVEVGGHFETAIGGMVTGIGIKKIDSNGKKFSVLEVDIDDTEKLSMNVNSPAAHSVIETFVNVDYTKPVVLLAWTDKAGYNKLSIKQDGTHVPNHFLDFKKVDGKFTVEFKNGYPERVAKDASDSQKTIARAQKQEFLEKHLEENIIPLVPKSVVDEVNDLASEFEDDLDPSQIDF